MESEKATATVDAVAPTAPKVDPTQGDKVTGTAEPGSTVIIKDKDGNVLAEVPADENGNFEWIPDTKLPNGTELNVTSKDKDGNVSDPTKVVTDSVAPKAPKVDPSNGKTVSGTAEPGTTITIRDEDGNVIATAKVDDAGNWSAKLEPAQADGAKLSVTATDAAGNESKPTTVVVDANAPEAPTVNPTNGKKVTGTAEPGSTVKIKDKNGKVLGDVVAKEGGTWTSTPKTPPKGATTLRVTSTDGTGNESKPVRVTVDAKAPPAPPVAPTDGTKVTGSAEPGTTVIIRDGNGNEIGRGVAGDDGRFEITPSSPLAPGTKLYVTAVDAAGNVSPSTEVTVAKAPVHGGGQEETPKPTDPPKDGGLSNTGADVLLPVGGAALLLVMGWFLLAGKRRKENQDA